MIIVLVILVSLLQVFAQSNPSVDWLTASSQPVHQKQFKGEILMFTTPWNRDGDELVQKYATKIDYYSPSIFDLGKKGSRIVVESFDEYKKNKQLYQRLKDKNPNIKILPRLYTSGEKLGILKELGSHQGVYNAFLDHIVKIAHQKHIDGFVWDSPYNMFSTERKWVQIGLLMKQITNDIKAKIGSKIILINLANPQDISKMNYDQLSALKADGFSIQNYGQGGYFKCIQSTHDFIKKANFKSKKIFFALPFFSKKNGEQLVSTQKVKESVESNGYFDAYHDEICYIDTNGNKYETPCPEYFKEAFERISPYNLGIWEGGNGVEEYYSLL